MTFWLDAQLDPKLAAWLGSRYKVVAKHLVELGLESLSDEEVFDAGRRFPGTVIVTKDSDFANLVRRLSSPPQILHLRCGNLSTIETQIWLSGAFASALRDLEAGQALVQIEGP